MFPTALVLVLAFVTLCALGEGPLALAALALPAALAALLTLRENSLRTLGVVITMVTLVVRDRDLTHLDDVRELAATAALGGAAPAVPSTRTLQAGPVAEAAPVRAEVERRRFWDGLPPAEREVLGALARREEFPAGTVLFRENQRADRVIVIEEGSVKVSVDAGGTDRQIALRGPGDLIGERAMLLVRERSATVVALTTVRALVASASEFNAFLDEHPHVIAVLERQFYDRLTHDAAAPGGQTPVRAPKGEIRPVLFADVVAFGGLHRDDGDRLVVRRVTYAVLREAFERSGIPWDGSHREDRGDGALIVLPPDVPPHLVLDPLAAHVAAALRVHNRRAAEAVRIRLRLALDAGPVTADPHGVSGSAVIRAARLLNAGEFKRRMDRSGAEVGLIVSGHVHDSVVKHAPGRVDPACYQRIEVAEKETRAPAWVAFAGTPGPGEPGRCDGRSGRPRHPRGRRRRIHAGGPAAPNR